jgi:hypothetical protein
VAVETSAGPQLGIAGTIECVDVSVWTCRDFVQAAAENRGSVELAIPSLDTTPSPDTTGSTSGTESGATPNGEQDTTDDEGQPTTGRQTQARYPTKSRRATRTAEQ